MIRAIADLSADLGCDDPARV
ncbi:MAG: hypothetical protein JWR06_3010, partial [Jatrophihabitans sp.]|nr:hypothetical protein [Jatrophihabitans sp.]